MFEGIKTLLNGAKASADSLRQQIKTIGDKLTKTAEIASDALSTAKSKANVADPVFTGSFSQNRKSDSFIGYHSHAEGYDTTARGNFSHAEGYSTTAGGDCSHAEGRSTTAGYSSHAEGYDTIADGYSSHAEGYDTIASGGYSHAEGVGTVAASVQQHTQGRYNIEDDKGKYAHIVGNGTGTSNRSNAHTLDWDGNAWFSGKVRIGGSSWEEGTELEGDTIYKLTALTKAAMPPMAVAENPMTVIKYNGRYYRLAKASEGATSKDITRYTYTTVDYNEIWKLYTLSLDYSKTTASLVEASTHEVMTKPIDYLTFTGENGNDFTLSASKKWDGTMWTSTDTKTWTEWDGTAVSSANGVLYLRGKNTTCYSTGGMQCQLNARADCSGNIMTLLDYESPNEDILVSSCFRDMFRGCTNLTTAPELPATTLANYCYSAMFYDCTSLITAPKLPATTLAGSCYNSMFRGCTNLTTAPELPATTLATSCYQYMFYDCTDLTTAPELPATTLAGSCYYYMFCDCTNLTTAPELPAIALADYCYNGMFNNCSSLKTAPELPATTLASYCYNSMFRGCTNLTTAPELPATTLATSCYQDMFYSCLSLKSAPELPATTLADSCYRNMFEDCTNLTTAPELPATTLAGSCYKNMFYGCTNLTAAPELPATTLADSCYSAMFCDCTNLRLSATQDATYRTPYRIPTTGDGVSASSALTGMFARTGGTFTGTPEINTTYYGAWD